MSPAGCDSKSIDRSTLKENEMIKKLTLLAFAVAALAAFAIPASASAAEFQVGGEPIKETEEVTLTGKAHFTTAIAGAEGTLHANVHFDPSTPSTATLKSLTVTNCKGLISLAGYTCHATAKNLPWTIHCNANNTVTITSVELENQYTGAEPKPNTLLTGNVIGTLGVGGSLDKITLSGEGTKADIVGTTTQLNATVEGTLEAETLGYSCA